jgi:hypothetical protein
MALKKSDLVYGVIINNVGSNYAYKLSDYVWTAVNGVDTKYWIALPGNVRTGDFILGTDPEATSLFTEKYILDSFDRLWVKEDRFKDGDILVDKDDMVFLYRKVNGVEKVWKMSGTNAWQATLASREAEYGTLKKVQRGWSGEDANFHKMI